MNRREELNAVVKESITTALLEMLEKKSLDKITITDLTTYAGVGRVSFYRNFESKEDVIRQHLASLVHVWTEEIESNNKTNLVEAVFDFFYGHRKLFLMLQRQGMSYLSLQCVKDSCGPKPEQDNPTAYYAAFLSYGLYGWITEWFQRGLVENPKEMTKLLEESMYKG